MDYSRLTDVMKPVRKGLLGVGGRGLVLEGHTFERTVFGSVQHPAPKHHTNTLRRVKFDRCTIETGPFWLSYGWEMEHVVIDKMKAWRLMISAQTPLRTVEITSYAKAGRLEILPTIATEHLKSRQFDIDGYHLDVSGYKGQLRIMGVNASAVVIDPARQFRLRLPDPEFRTSSITGLNGDSLMSIALEQMVGWRVRDAVLSLPPPSDRYFDQENDALELLKKTGIAF